LGVSYAFEALMSVEQMLNGTGLRKGRPEKISTLYCPAVLTLETNQTARNRSVGRQRRADI